MTGHTEEIEELLQRYQISSAVNRPTERRAAIQAILDVYRAPIYRLSFSILRDEDEAQDACQETFIRAYDHLSGYQPGTNLRAWLYRIAVNVCRGHLRKRRTRETIFRTLTALHISQGLAESPESAVLRDEHKARLWAAVGQLGEKHRLVVILRVAHELTVREIAQILGIPQKTVYTRLYDSFRKLRELLREAEFEDY